MSDPTPIKPLDWHGFLRILAAHDTQTEPIRGLAGIDEFVIEVEA